MCGIFGIVLTANASISRSSFEALLERLYRLSESRGKESAGLHISLPVTREGLIFKSATSASELLRDREFRLALNRMVDAAYRESEVSISEPIIAIAHSRLVTNGRSERPENNQPVLWGDVTMIHNGIVVNVDELWSVRSDLKRAAEVDTEVLAAIVSSSMSRQLDPVAATQNAYQVLKGAASIAWTHAETATLTLATNTGDLHVAIIDEGRGLVFASEKFILSESLQNLQAAHQITAVKPGNGMVLDVMKGLSTTAFDIKLGDASYVPARLERARVEQPAGVVPASINIRSISADESLLCYDEGAMRKLRRCSVCILPETFPFISFDNDGVCNYCHGYRIKYKGRDVEAAKREFFASLEGYRSRDGAPDVLVPFSGGRDSCYGLHLIKKEFGFNPITFTYDWGMVTDLARRNIARMCGSLGVPNILVSANIREKRDNVRKNVAAWLNKPDLGMVPLFMAGDKHFFKIVNDLKRQTGVRLDLWSANPLENTDFKSGFCGVKPDFDKSRLDYLSLGRKLKLASYYLNRFIGNPGYINGSLIDTARAFVSYYVEPRRDFFFMFNHVVWDERAVNETIIGEYDFERAPDSPSTWRIGDGTAPFYNYIYMTARGFTEFDTFRSNQIREGQIDRASALEAVLVENRPRIDGLKWYLDVIGLDFNDTIKVINELDSLGLHH